MAHTGLHPHQASVSTEILAWSQTGSAGGLAGQKMADRRSREAASLGAQGPGKSTAQRRSQGRAGEEEGLGHSQ